VALELLPFHVTDLPGPCPSFTHTTVAVTVALLCCVQV
jgi:hypothetical protein